MQSAQNLDNKKVDRHVQDKLNLNFLKEFLTARESKDFKQSESLLAQGADKFILIL